MSALKSSQASKLRRYSSLFWGIISWGGGWVGGERKKGGQEKGGKMPPEGRRTCREDWERLGCADLNRGGRQKTSGRVGYLD